MSLSSMSMLRLGLLLICVCSALSLEGPRRLRIAYYGARKANVTASYLSVLKSSGITDAWIPYLQGAFAVDCCKKNDTVYRAGGLHAGLMSLAAAETEGLVTRYQAQGIRPWFFERPVPDFEYTGVTGTIGPDLWNSSSDRVEARD